LFDVPLARKKLCQKNAKMLKKMFSSVSLTQHTRLSAKMLLDESREKKKVTQEKLSKEISSLHEDA
jgi:uncharacterized membrane-anchored protein YhcB (DUF1043 family)